MIFSIGEKCRVEKNIAANETGVKRNSLDARSG